MINTILLDFDGTLMDTHDLVLKSWQHTFLHFEGEERPEQEVVSTFGEPLNLTMRKVLPHIDVQEAIDVYRAYHYDHFEDLIKLFDGMENLLIEAKKKGYKLGVVTSRLERTTLQGLRKYDLEKYFDAVVTIENCEKHKPDPEPIVVALDKLKSRPQDSLMIGDTWFDIECAKNAGVRSILVGWTRSVGLDEMKSDFILERAEDLWELPLDYRQ